MRISVVRTGIQRNILFLPKIFLLFRPQVRSRRSWRNPRLHLAKSCTNRIHSCIEIHWRRLQKRCKLEGRFEYLILLASPRKEQTSIKENSVRAKRTNERKDEEPRRGGNLAENYLRAAGARQSAEARNRKGEGCISKKQRNYTPPTTSSRHWFWVLRQAPSTAQKKGKKKIDFCDISPW